MFVSSSWPTSSHSHPNMSLAAASSGSSSSMSISSPSSVPSAAGTSAAGAAEGKCEDDAWEGTSASSISSLEAAGMDVFFVRRRFGVLS